MLASVALLALQGNVALTDRAVRLDALLKELSAKTGVVHRASGEMMGRIVLATGPARPATEIRADLAAATWGLWRKVGDELLLDEDRDGVRARDRARLAIRIASFVAAQEGLRAKGDQPFDAAKAKRLLADLERNDRQGESDEGSYERFAALEAETPANAALRRVVLSLDPEALAALPDGKVVFSERPTRLQRGLPSAATASIRRLEREQTVWSGIHSDSESWARGRGGSYMADPRNFAEATSQGSLRLLLKADVARNGMSFQAWFVDGKGTAQGFANLNLPVTSSPPRTVAPELDPKEKPLTLDPSAAALAEALHGRATPAIRALLLRPETVEPLDLYPAEVCRAVARERKVALTVWLDDNLVAFAEGYHDAEGKRGNTAGEWIRALWVRGYNPTPRTGALVLRPRGAATNVDRARMGTLLRAADRLGYPALDDLADYAVGQPSMPMIVESIGKALLPGSETSFDSDWTTLRLWGGFTRLQRHAFANGATIPFRNLSPAHREAFVAAIVASDYDELQSEGDKPGFIRPPEEPTELLANGFALDAGITGSLNVSEGVRAPGPAEEGWSPAFADPEALAQSAFRRERFPGEGRFDMFPKALPTAYVPGHVVRFGLHAMLAPGLNWNKSAEHAEFDARAKPAPMTPAFKKAYDESLAHLRSTQGNTPAP